MYSKSLEHLAIIPDGNRRWSKRNNVNLADTYLQSCEMLFEICPMLCRAVGSLKEISLFFVSLENLRSRSSVELDAVFMAGRRFVDLFYSQGLNLGFDLRWVGLDHPNFEVQSQLYRQFLTYVRTLEPARNCEHKINVLIGYDVRRDIESAITKSSEFDFSNLEVGRPVDLVIRTGGSRRLSGFLPLNCQYAEFSFIDKLFLDVTRSDIEVAVSMFLAESRKFGV